MRLAAAVGCTGYMQSTRARCATGHGWRGLQEYTGTGAFTGCSLLRATCHPEATAQQIVGRHGASCLASATPNLNSSAGSFLG